MKDAAFGELVGLRGKAVLHKPVGTGLYSCTLTGNDRLKVRFLLGRVLRVMDAITLTVSASGCCLCVMLLAGWKLTGLVYVSTVAIGPAIRMN